LSKFITALVVECIDDTAAQGRGFWKVMQPFTYQSDILGKTITVEPDFITDYASVPRVPVLYFLFGDTTHKAAVLHDWLFHHHEVCNEQTANLVLREAAEAEGIVHWRKMGIYLGVKFGGKSSWEADARSNGHTIVNGQII
jgi:hypothetical protein